MKYKERFASEINQFIDANKLDELSSRLESSNILEITQAFSRLSPEKQEVLLNLLPVEKSARILKLSLRFNHSLSSLLERLDSKKFSEILSQCDPDDARELLRLLPRSDEKNVLNNLTSAEVAEIQNLATYPDGTIGNLMNPRVVALTEDMTVDESFRNIRKHAEAEMVFYLYVLDYEKKLKGVVSLRRLVTSAPHQIVRDLMIPSVVDVNAEQSIVDVAEVFEKTGFLALPVLDNYKHLLGMVSRDDVLEQVREKTEETFLKISGVSPEEFYGAPIYKIVPLRLPWLLASLCGGMLNAMLLHHYTGMLSVMIALTLFIPVMLGLSETVGTQTATLIIRGLALGQMENKEFRKLILKEIGIGMIIGFLCGIVLGGITYLWLGKSVVVAIILISITLGVTLAGFIGTSIPLVFKMLKLDPVMGTSAFVLSACDICTILIYLFTAAKLLPYPA